ncbi:MAG: acyl-CoA carboxylase subunit beta [Deltaproteobacteria bacterium]|nr:acyl-CoA carboxylase subunit beta [Deltaproteobacteria bacterium]
MSLQDKLDELIRRNKEAELGGGQGRIDSLHQKGKLTARERVEALMDKDSFQEIDKFVVHRCYNFGAEKTKIPGDGVVTGYGTINGRMTFVFSHDSTVFGGSLSGPFGEKVCKVMDLAVNNKCPIVGLNDSGGARIQEGVISLGSYGEIFKRNVMTSGVIPQISVIMGACAGGAVYSPAITDFIIMVDKTSHMFITGHQVIKAVTSEDVSAEKLGGAMTHNAISGVAHFSAKSDLDALKLTKELLAFFPQNSDEKPTVIPCSDPADRIDMSLRDVVPDNAKKPYNIKEIIRKIVDHGHFFEVQKNYARNMVVGFARMGGMSVGFVANQPNFLAGCIDINASLKCSRFVRSCDCFNIPLITLVDVPGFLPGVSQEHGGIIKHGSKIIYAYVDASVPKITVITRKAYGGAYDVMSSKHHGGDINYAYPTAEVAVMGPEGAVNIIMRKELNAVPEEEREALREKLIADYRKTFANPYTAAELGYIDEVISPEYTRPKVIAALRMLKNKVVITHHRKHGNIPL